MNDEDMALSTFQSNQNSSSMGYSRTGKSSAAAAGKPKLDLGETNILLQNTDGSNAMFNGDSSFSRVEDDSEQLCASFNLTSHPVVQQIEDEERKSSVGRPSILEESKESSFNNHGDVLEEFAREQQLAEEREDLENDILRDFE